MNIYPTKLLNIIPLFALFLVSGCASYGPASDGNRLSNGYKDRKISENRFWVYYQGDVYDTSSSVLKLWKKRAEELCAGKGYVGQPIEGATPYTYSAGVYGVHRSKLIKFEGEIVCNL